MQASSAITSPLARVSQRLTLGANTALPMISQVATVAVAPTSADHRLSAWPNIRSSGWPAGRRWCTSSAPKSSEMTDPAIPMPRPTPRTASGPNAAAATINRTAAIRAPKQKTNRWRDISGPRRAPLTEPERSPVRAAAQELLADGDRFLHGLPVQRLGAIRGPVVVERQLGVGHRGQRRRRVSGAQRDQPIGRRHRPQPTANPHPHPPRRLRQLFAQPKRVVAHPEHSLALEHDQDRKSTRLNSSHVAISY